MFVLKMLGIVLVLVGCALFLTIGAVLDMSIGEVFGVVCICVITAGSIGSGLYLIFNNK